MKFFVSKLILFIFSILICYSQQQQYSQYLIYQKACDCLSQSICPPPSNPYPIKLNCNINCSSNCKCNNNNNNNEIFIKLNNNSIKKLSKSKTPVHLKLPVEAQQKLPSISDYDDDENKSNLINLKNTQKFAKKFKFTVKQFYIKKS